MKLFQLKKKNLTLGGGAYRKMLVVADDEEQARQVAFEYSQKNKNGLGVDPRSADEVYCDFLGVVANSRQKPKVLTSFLQASE